MNLPQKLTRSCKLDRAEADTKARTVSLAFSSEEPVRRWFGWEVLDHSRRAVRLDRMERAPVLLEHNTGQHVGVVERVAIGSDRVARAVVRFGRGKLADEVFQDVVDGIRQQVSVGYEIHTAAEDGRGDDGETVYRVSDWSPFELSIVAIAADPSVGVGRSEEIMTTETTEPEKQTRSQRRAENQAVEAEKYRAAEILGIGKAHGLETEAAKAVTDGTSIEEFREIVLDHIRARNRERQVISDVPGYAGMPADSSRYGSALGQLRMTDAILAQLDPQKYGRQAGLLRDVSQDLERQMGREAAGLMLPLEMFQVRAVQYSGTGSNLVATQHLDGEYIDLLRNSSRVLQAGARQLPGLQGNVAIPAAATGATGYWFAGDDADAITQSDPTFGQRSLEPHFLGYLSKYSLRTLTQSAPGIEQLVRDDQARGAGVSLDAAAIAGDGAGATPRGILATSGIGSTTYANGGSPGFADVVGLETTIAAANADGGGLSYMTTPAIAGSLKTTDVGTDTGQFVWSAGREPGTGMVNGLPAWTSGNVTAGYVICGDFSELLVGMWGGVEVLVNPYEATDYARGTVGVRTILTADFALRHPEAFAEIHEAAP